MTDKAISPLRRRMIVDMTIRKLAPKTQRDYVQRVKKGARPPSLAAYRIALISRTCAAISFIWAGAGGAALVYRPSIRPYLSCVSFSGSRSGATISSSTRISFTSRASCRWCQPGGSGRGCSMPHPGSSTRRAERAGPTARGLRATEAIALRS